MTSTAGWAALTTAWVDHAPHAIDRCPREPRHPVPPGLLPGSVLQRQPAGGVQRRGPLTTGVYQDQPFWERTAAGHLPRAAQTTGLRNLQRGQSSPWVYDYRSAAQQAATSASWINREDRRFLWDHRAEMPAEPLPWPRPCMACRRNGAPAGSSAPTRLGTLPDDQLPVQPDVQNANTVIQWLQDPPPQPFFMTLGLYRPHLPWYVAQSDLDRYPLDALPARVLANDLDDVPDIAKTWALNPADHATITGNGQWKQAVQRIWHRSPSPIVKSACSRRLKSPPAADNTTVVLWSDNGFHWAKTPLAQIHLVGRSHPGAVHHRAAEGANPTHTSGDRYAGEPVGSLPHTVRAGRPKPPKTHLDGHRLGALLSHTSGGNRRSLRSRWHR